ncbi:MAG: glycosyltransferase family 1 protein [Patescibacteria group bacterium]
MNIGIDIRPLMTAPRTGVGEYTYELLNAIFNLDKNNQYFLFYNSSRDVSANIPKWDFPNVKIIDSHIPNKFFNFGLGVFKYPKLDKVFPEKIDLWFSPNLNFTALSREIKYILTIHDISFDLFPKFSTRKQFFWHKAIRPKNQCERANVIITPSENTKRDIVNYYKISPEKIKVIYPGVGICHPREGGDPGRCDWIPDQVGNDTPKRNTDIKQKYNLPEKFILFLGTIEPRKNIIGLIEAFETYRAKNQSVEHLVIAGAPGWKNEEIYARAKNSNLADKIHFINFVAPEDKDALYASADLFVYPSLYEGFGFPVLEAMSLGTPVITSNRSSLPEVTGSAAYLIDPTRPEQLALAMNELLNNKNLRDWHIQKGLEQVKKYSWDKAGREWLNILK